MARETTPAFHCRWTPARGKMSRSSGRGGSRRVLQTRQRLSLISAVEGGARQDVAFWFPSRKSACVRWRLPALTSLLYVTLPLKCFTFQQLWFQWIFLTFPHSVAQPNTGFTPTSPFAYIICHSSFVTLLWHFKWSVAPGEPDSLVDCPLFLARVGSSQRFCRMCF